METIQNWSWNLYSHLVISGNIENENENVHAKVTSAELEFLRLRLADSQPRPLLQINGSHQNIAGYLYLNLYLQLLLHLPRFLLQKDAAHQNRGGYDCVLLPCLYTASSHGQLSYLEELKIQ